MNNQTAFGGMLHHLVELTSIVLRPEPLDQKIERHCKQMWEEAPCPDCGETTVKAGDSSPRLWCTNCRYTFTYIRNNPSKAEHSHPERSLSPSSSTLIRCLVCEPVYRFRYLLNLSRLFLISGSNLINLISHLFKITYNSISHTRNLFG